MSEKADNTGTSAISAAQAYKVNEVYGRIVVIKRTGQDSASFELMDDSYTFGRYLACLKKVNYLHSLCVGRLIVILEFNYRVLPRSIVELRAMIMVK